MAIHGLNIYLANPLSHKHNCLTLQGLTEVHPGVGSREAEEFCDDRTLKVANAILDVTAM